jgi:hypothetical protein
MPRYPPPKIIGPRSTLSRPAVFTLLRQLLAENYLTEEQRRELAEIGKLANGELKTAKESPLPAHPTSAHQV